MWALGPEILGLNSSSPSGFRTLVLLFKLGLGFLICKMEMLVVSKVRLLWGLMRWCIYSVNKKGLWSIFFVQGSVLSHGVCPCPWNLSGYNNDRHFFLSLTTCPLWISFSSAPFSILRPRLRSSSYVEHASKGRRAMTKPCTPPQQSRRWLLGQCVTWFQMERSLGPNIIAVIQVKDLEVLGLDKNRSNGEKRIAGGRMG